MLDVEDESILIDFENAEISNPSPRKLVGNRTIYCSRKLAIPKKHGRPVLADFGEARFGSDTGTYCSDVQPFIYRAPEVLLRMPWNEKIDIWNIAVLVGAFNVPYLYVLLTTFRPGTSSNEVIFSTPVMQTSKTQRAITLLK